jgi:serine/threonine protein kinase
MTDSKPNLDAGEGPAYEPTVSVDSRVADVIRELPTGLIFRGDYYVERVRKLGKGGLGEVWLANEVTPGDSEEIAIKFSYRSPASLDSLRNEVYLAKQLKHEGIGAVRRYQFNAESGIGSVTMDYIPGDNLQTISQRHQSLGLHIPQLFAAFVGWESTISLNYAHNARVMDKSGRERIGIIHRDITPTNVIVNEHGYPKLIDFGIGVLQSDYKQGEVLGRIAGKPGFIAPEMFEGQEADERSDIYSLGMLLDYLVRGNNPLLQTKGAGSSGSAVMDSIKAINEGFAPLQDEVKGIDPKFAELVLKATDKDPSKRFQTAKEMRGAIGAYIYGKGFGPTRDALRDYLQIINTPGLEANLAWSRESNIRRPNGALKTRLEQAKEPTSMPYMFRENRFRLESLVDSGGEIFIPL